MIVSLELFFIFLRVLLFSILRRFMQIGIFVLTLVLHSFNLCGFTVENGFLFPLALIIVNISRGNSPRAMLFIFRVLCLRFFC